MHARSQTQPGPSCRPHRRANLDRIHSGLGSHRVVWPGSGRWVRTGVTIALLAGGSLGCGEGTAPTGPRVGGQQPGDVLLVEGSSNWVSESITWTHANQNGVVSESDFGLIAVSRRSTIDGQPHVFFNANVGLACDDDECFPSRGATWTDPQLQIFQLDWSVAGAQVTFVGREVRGIYDTGPAWIYVMPASGGEPRRRVRGLMPSFSRDGGRIVYVDNGRHTLRQFNPDSNENLRDLVEGGGIQHPRMSPGDSLVAYSASTPRGQRIHVLDVRHPEQFADPVSDSDDFSRRMADGVGDDYPTWSPDGRFVAYKSRVQSGNVLKDAVFVTEPASEPENVVEIASMSPGGEISGLRWHPTNGRYLLYIFDGDVYLLITPDRFWGADRANLPVRRSSRQRSQ